MILQGQAYGWNQPPHHKAPQSGRGEQQWDRRKGEKVGSEGLLLLNFYFLSFSTIVTIFSIGCLHFMCPEIVLVLVLWTWYKTDIQILCVCSSKDGPGFPMHGWPVKSEFCWVPQKLFHVKYALLSSWNSLAVPRAPGGREKNIWDLQELQFMPIHPQGSY